jgi:hypothetical protein
VKALTDSGYFIQAKKKVAVLKAYEGLPLNLKI